MYTHTEIYTHVYLCIYRQQAYGGCRRRASLPITINVKTNKFKHIWVLGDVTNMGVLWVPITINIALLFGEEHTNK